MRRVPVSKAKGRELKEADWRQTRVEEADAPFRRADRCHS